MKKGCNQYEPFYFRNVDLDDVESIEFIFMQDDKEMKKCTYPSSICLKDDDKNAIMVFISAAESYKFNANPIIVDTRIHLTDSVVNPATTPVKLTMDPTYFKE